MFEKGNQASRKEVKKDNCVQIRTTKKEKETIVKAANGNISRYFLNLHRENLR
jgi:hypothetical protein